MILDANFRKCFSFLIIVKRDSTQLSHHGFTWSLDIGETLFLVSNPYFVKGAFTTRAAFCLVVYMYSFYVQNLERGNGTDINASSRITIVETTCCFLGKAYINNKMDFVTCNSIFIFNKMQPLDIERPNRASTHTFLRRHRQLEVESSFFLVFIVNVRSGLKC